MARSIQVAGAAAIYVDTASSHTLELLGYTRDGAFARFDGYFHDVPVDTHGGEAGPPADVQFMGETALVTLEFTSYDEAVAQKIRPRTYGGTAGTPAAAGLLMLGGSLFHRLVINSAVTPLNFPCAVFREPYEINKGTKFSSWRVEATAYAHPSTGILYNATVA